MEKEKINPFSCTQPCNNCPYKKDAPLKLWHRSEYEKLEKSESDYMGSVYNCHKNNGTVCIGWLIKQDENYFPSISLRMLLFKYKITREYLDRLKSPSPLYKSVKAMIKANYPKK